VKEMSDFLEELETFFENFHSNKMEKEEEGRQKLERYVEKMEYEKKMHDIEKSEEAFGKYEMNDPFGK
jgi:hypothetical protein